jgi:hypothetical protein
MERHIMVLNIAPDLEAALNEVASRQGVSAEELAIKALKDRFARPKIEPRNEWERTLLAAASDCGVSLLDEAVSSEGIYD